MSSNEVVANRQYTLIRLHAIKSFYKAIRLEVCGYNLENRLEVEYSDGDGKSWITRRINDFVYLIDKNSDVLFTDTLSDITSFLIHDEIKIISRSPDQMKLHFFYWQSIHKHLTNVPDEYKYLSKYFDIAMILGFDALIGAKGRCVPNDERLHKRLISTAQDGTEAMKKQYGDIGIYTIYKSLQLDAHYQPAD